MKFVFTGALTLALLSGSLLAGSAAFAGPREFTDHARYAHVVARDYGHEWRAPARWVAPERGWYRPYGYGFRAPYAAHFWRRGEFLPAAYFGRGAWIANYPFYGLRAPPPGCAWVQVGGEFVLTAIATGLVVDVVHHLLG